MRLIKYILPGLIFLCNVGFAQKKSTAFHLNVSKWFHAWELISNEVYHLDKLEPVDFIFFDDKYVYSTSSITIPKGIIVKGPKLLNHKFAWKRELHHDSLTLPDKSRVPIGLMSFASQQPGKKSFFVMPLPSFWLKAGITSKEFGTENLTTGVFVHEFSHSQQMQNFGKRITEFEKASHFGVEFSDDIVNIFLIKTHYMYHIIKRR